MPERPAKTLPALPRIIQGGMGAGVSGWRLAQAVARTGQLGVVSGVALDTLLARKLQLGDPDGDMRRALAAFPSQDVAERILARYYVAGGIKPGTPFRPVPRIGLLPNQTRTELTMAANFVEVWLAREGHDGVVGINYLEKIQLATPAGAYGAMLAGVDFILMGAGIPAEIPALLDALATHSPAEISVTVAGSDDRHTVGIDPAAIMGDAVTYRTDDADGPADLPNAINGAITGGVNGAHHGRFNGAVRGTLGRDADGTEPLDSPAAAERPATQPAGQPAEQRPGLPERLKRPKLLAIVSSNVLAMYLARSAVTRPDGFILEGPVAGGHSAPPRGKLQFSESGEPVYGPRDEIDLAKVAALGLPFWLAGGYATPEALAEARAAGATGIQVGTAFALCRESGFDPELRRQLLERAVAGTLKVINAPCASPAGFPFKVAELAGTVSGPESYDQRSRLCDLGYLRTPYEKPNGGVGYRCAAEPVDVYIRKGGTAEETVGRRCLCNGLISNIGLAQHRPDGYAEPPLITLGQDLTFLPRLLQTVKENGGGAGAPSETGAGATGFTEFGAEDVIRYLEAAP